MIDSYHTSIAVKPKPKKVISTETTLYELIEAVSDTVTFGEERRIPEIVLNLINSGQMRILSSLDYLKAKQADPYKNLH
jgi:hypothetical protein